MPGGLSADAGVLPLVCCRRSRLHGAAPVPMLGTLRAASTARLGRGGSSTLGLSPGARWDSSVTSQGWFLWGCSSCVRHSSTLRSRQQPGPRIASFLPAQRVLPHLAPCPWAICAPRQLSPRWGCASELPVPRQRVARVGAGCHVSGHYFFLWFALI